jgi:hypothetical protein
MTREYLVDGVDRYLIRFERDPASYYKLFADRRPPDPFGKGAQEHHLFTSGQICVSAGEEPRTLDRARAIAQFWCQGFSTYRRTGVFPNRACRVVV